MKIKNAVITNTMLGVEDHGIFTFGLTLDYGGISQGAGHYSLDGHAKDKDYRPGFVSTAPLLRRILEICGVDKWEDLKGQHIRVEAEHCKVHKIGHIIKDEWLEFESFIKDIEADSTQPKKEG